MILFIQKTALEDLIDLSTLNDTSRESFESDRYLATLMDTFSRFLESDISQELKQRIMDVSKSEETVSEETIQALIAELPDFFKVFEEEDYNFKRDMFLEKLTSLKDLEFNFLDKEEEALFYSAVESLIQALEEDVTDSEQDFQSIFETYKALAVKNLIV